MYQEIEKAAPHRALDTYTVSTPYGTVIISDGGRKVAFELYSDIKQSRHNQALFTYIQQLIKRGVTQFNTDHITIAGRDRRLGLTRGRAKLDLVYTHQGQTYECELKTSREIGLDITAQQLKEFAKHCERLIVLVPRGCIDEMSTILHMINLNQNITIEPYDSSEDEESPPPG
ncbi:hypothetical protein ES703_11817 [subsurface metagenome]